METSTHAVTVVFVLAVALVLFASRHVARTPSTRARRGRRGAPARVGTGGEAAVKHALARERVLDLARESERRERFAAHGRGRTANAPRWRGNGDVPRARARARRASRRRLRRRVYGRAGGSRGSVATTHLWRLLCFGAAFAEGVSLSSLAFAANTAPWWGRTVASAVGRALAFQLDAPGMYIVRDALAACVAVAGAAATFHAVYHRTELGTARDART